MYSIELYANSAIPRWRTSITDNYDEQLQCTAQCIPCSTGSGWVEVTRIPSRFTWIATTATAHGWLQTVYKPQRATEDQHVCRKKTRGIESWSDVNSYSIYHIRSNKSLTLRCKTIFHKVVPKCPDRKEFRKGPPTIFCHRRVSWQDN